MNELKPQHHTQSTIDLLDSFRIDYTINADNNAFFIKANGVTHALLMEEFRTPTLGLVLSAYLINSSKKVHYENRLKLIKHLLKLQINDRVNNLQAK